MRYWGNPRTNALLALAGGLASDPTQLGVSQPSKKGSKKNGIGWHSRPYFHLFLGTGAKYVRYSSLSHSRRILLSSKPVWGSCSDSNEASYRKPYWYWTERIVFMPCIWGKDTSNNPNVVEGNALSESLTKSVMEKRWWIGADKSWLVDSHSIHGGGRGGGFN